MATRTRSARVRERPGRRRRRAAPRQHAFESSSPAMPAQPAPSAARMASSCWRPSARTSSRLATLAQAISSTTPMVPISTHSTLPRSPTTSCFRGRTLGRMRASSNSLTLKPGGGGNFDHHGNHARDIGVGLGQGDTRLEPCDALVAEVAEGSWRDRIGMEGSVRPHRGTGSSAA